ncbi:MAG: hypothetical protein JWN94_2982 [Betaproteobacteria bacterium]|nr:hypothetical protein [Betaproteobacteria bacterium]
MTSNSFISACRGAALFIALIFPQVAPAQVHAVPITDPPLLYELDGYSVLPPPGKSWFEMQRDKQQALFGKRIESPTHSFGATATSDVINEKFETREKFQEYVNKLRTAEFDPARFRVIEFDSKVDESHPAWCVRYRLKHTDRNAVLARNRTLTVEDFGITCLHPDRTNLIIDVGYSERGRIPELATELSATLRKEGEAFVRSLKLKLR